MDNIVTIVKDISALLIALSAFVEIMPIKINPWSWLCKKLGNAFNHDLREKVEALTQDVNKLKETQLETRKKELRLRISDFASDLRHNVPKSETQFVTIIELCDEYIDHNWNSKVRLDAEFIKEEYLTLGEKVKKHEIYIKDESE